MRLDFSREAYKDFQEWILTERKKASKILDLLTDIEKHAFEGWGKPEYNRSFILQVPLLDKILFKIAGLRHKGW